VAQLGTREIAGDTSRVASNSLGLLSYPFLLPRPGNGDTEARDTGARLPGLLPIVFLLSSLDELRADADEGLRLTGGSSGSWNWTWGWPDPETV